MEKQILVPLDRSRITEEVIGIADGWAQRTDAKLTFLHVDPSINVESDHLMDILETYLKRRDLKPEYRTLLKYGHAGMKILEAAQEIRPDILIMGAHSHGLLGRLFLGSTTDYVLHHCPFPVYVHKKAKDVYSNQIIVPVDYSDVNRTVIKIADEWALRTKAELHFLHVNEMPEYGGNFYAMETGFYQHGDDKDVSAIDNAEHSEDLSKVEQNLVDFLSELQVTAKYKATVAYGKPYLKILEMQRETQAMLIMMAAHSHTFLGRVFLGSNTDYLLHHARCPMYVYKEG